LSINQTMKRLKKKLINFMRISLKGVKEELEITLLKMERMTQIDHLFN